MKIRISAENEKKIESELKKVNGLSSAHCYTLFSEIKLIAKCAEDATRKLLTKKDMAGATFAVESGRAMPGSYKGVRNTTKIEIARTSTGWFLTSVNRGNLWPSQHGCERLTLTSAQSEIAVARFLSGFSVEDQ